MKQKNTRYTVQKRFRFYCLILREEGANYIYVGKTTGLRMSAEYSRHICGRVAATVDFFDGEEKPQLHILSECTATTAEAYKIVVAYVRLFVDAGYICINHEGTMAHAEQPKEKTLAIIRSLESEPIEDLLSRTYIAKPADADRKPAQKIAEEESTIQMNIRIKPSDKDVFDQFRKKQRLNQQEAFSLLLDQTDNRHYTDLLLKKDEKIRKMEHESERLREKLKRQKTPPAPKKEVDANEFLDFAKKGLAFYESLLPLPPNVQPLPRNSYRHFTRNLLIGPSYEYPADEGFAVLALERVLWSNGRTKACFLLGLDLEERRVKLRYYPKGNQLICSFLDSVYAYPGAMWLAGYRQAKDQAMELVLAIPLCFAQISSNENDIIQTVESEKTDRKLSLDAQIDLATQR